MTAEPAQGNLYDNYYVRKILNPFHPINWIVGITMCLALNYYFQIIAPKTIVVFLIIAMIISILNYYFANSNVKEIDN